MRRAGMHAGGKGVQAADAMRKALGHQKFQRAIGDRRFVAKTFGGKALQHIIGPKRAMFFQQDLQACGGAPVSAAGPHPAASASARASTSPAQWL